MKKIHTMKIRPEECILFVPLFLILIILYLYSLGQEKKWNREHQKALNKLCFYAPEWLSISSSVVDNMIWKIKHKNNPAFQKLFNRYSFCYLQLAKKHLYTPNPVILERIIEICKVDSIRNDALNLLIKYSSFYRKRQEESKKFQTTR